MRDDVGFCESMAEGRDLQLQKFRESDNPSTGRVIENTHFYGARENVSVRESFQRLFYCPFKALSPGFH